MRWQRSEGRGWPLLRLGILAWLALISSGCCPPQRTRTLERLSRPPPLEPAPTLAPVPAGAVVRGGADGCPAEWAACLTAVAAAELVRYLEEVAVWARNAQEACR